MAYLTSSHVTTQSISTPRSTRQTTFLTALETAFRRIALQCRQRHKTQLSI